MKWRAKAHGTNSTLYRLRLGDSFSYCICQMDDTPNYALLRCTAFINIRDLLNLLSISLHTL